MTKAPTDYHKEERCLLVHSFREISVRHGGGKDGDRAAVHGDGHTWLMLVHVRPTRREADGAEPRWTQPSKSHPSYVHFPGSTSWSLPAFITIPQAENQPFKM